MYCRFFFFFLTLISFTGLCEGLNRDIEFNSIENYFEHHGYFCYDCLKRFDYFSKKEDWDKLENYIGLIPNSQQNFCDRCLIFKEIKIEGIYAPYFTGKDYFDLLQDHLIYCQKNRDCRCYWPEVNEASSEICDSAFELFSYLFSSTALIQVVNSGDKQQDLLLSRPINTSRYSLHGLMIALLSKSFFFSHYYRICQDIDRFSKQTFDRHKYAIIQNKLEFILSNLGEKYLQIYNSCLEKMTVSEYRKVVNGFELQVFFEKYLETGETFLKNAWVIVNK